MNTKIRWLISLILFHISFPVYSYHLTDYVHHLVNNSSEVLVRVPDQDILNSVVDFDLVKKQARQQTYVKMLKQETDVQVMSQDEFRLQLKKQVRTFVIVPGVFSEFIKTRAFEEIFSGHSTFKQEWGNKLKFSGIQDQRYDLASHTEKIVSLGEVLNASSIDDQQGNPLVKIILLKTNSGSLESLGQIEEVAAVFNRRLEKYAQLYPQDHLTLIGYSRGTPLALEMLVQSEKQNLDYLSQVTDLVALSGVIMGSSTADITDDTSTDQGRLYAELKKLSNSLETSNSYFQTPFQFLKNAQAIAEFLKVFRDLESQSPDQTLLFEAVRSVDLTNIFFMVKKLISEAQLKSIFDFNQNVVKFKKIIDSLLAAIDGLKTSSRQDWWRKNELPRSIKYSSLPAVMLDPKNSLQESLIYKSQVGYNDSLDDKLLQSQRRTYAKNTGFQLNDSQVALHQSLFLPQVIANLNDKNSHLKIENMAVLQTHHWGVAMPSVSEMKDGRLNPFPREKILISLAAYLNQKD